MPEINYQNSRTRDLVIEMAKYWLSKAAEQGKKEAEKLLKKIR